MGDKKKADLILEKLDRVMQAFDDVSAAVDEFHLRLKKVEARLSDFEETPKNIRDDITNILAETSRLSEIEDHVRRLDSTCSDYGNEINRLTEEIGVVASQLDEMDYERRSAERQRHLFEARAAMGKVRFLALP